MKYLCLPSVCLFFLFASLSLSVRHVFASDSCQSSSSAPQDKTAVAVGFAIYSDVVKGSTIDGAGAVVCLDDSGEVISPPPTPLICSLKKGSEDATLAYDSTSGSLVANVTDLEFVSTHNSASVSFEVNKIESPEGSDLLVKAADFSSNNGFLELQPGIPVLMASLSQNSTIPFTIEFTNGHLAGTYRGIVTVTCYF